jgi:lipid A 3-O-deacylase
MIQRLTTFLLTSFFTVSALAANGYFIEVATGDNVRAVRLGMIQQWQEQWLEEGRWHVTGYWEGSLGQLESTRADGKSATSLGVTPVFRFRPHASGGTQPYWDIAVGLHLLSRSRLDARRHLGGAIQLAPLVGVGVTFGEKSQYDLGYRFQGLTRLSSEDDNLDLHQVRLTYLY